MTAPPVWTQPQAACLLPGAPFFADGRWVDLSARLGYFKQRLPLPAYDATSPLGALLAQRGFVARRHDESGVHVLFADPANVARADLAPLEDAFGLRIFQYGGLLEPGVTTLLEITIVDPTRARHMFVTRRHPAAPLKAARPSDFFNQVRKQKP